MNLRVIIISYIRLWSWGLGGGGFMYVSEKYGLFAMCMLFLSVPWKNGWFYIKK